MTGVFLFTVSIAVVELLIRTPLALFSKTIMEMSHKAYRTMSSRKISDHWKERSLLFYSREIFRGTIGLLAWFLVIGVCIRLLVWFVDAIDQGFSSFLMSLHGITLSSAVSILYYFLRTRVVLFQL